MDKNRRGITLIALVITIIVLLILAGITINLTIGQNGILKQAQNAGIKNAEAEAKQKLELALLDLQTEKVINKEYNENEYIDNYLTSKQMVVMGDIVLVDGWQFKIDRSVPEIGISLGKGEESKDITLTASVKDATDYTKANINIEIIYEGEISSIQINGKEEEIPEKIDGKYAITKEVLENGAYTILVKDESDNYKIAVANITEISEDLVITSVEDLVAFRNRVNQGATYKGRTITVANDLDLSGVCSSSLGSWTQINNFHGIFEGNNHIISNLYINNSSDYQAMFRGNYGTIKNLIMDNAYVKTTSADAAIIVYNNNGTISNCTTKGTVIADLRVGAIGISNNGIITNCKNYANVSTIMNNGTKEYAGGIVCNNNKNISNSYNAGNVTGYSHAGGIAADHRGTTSNSATINSCYNSGAIKCNASSNVEYEVAGGICGYAAWGNTQTYIYNCYNIGAVYSAINSGGIVGGSSGEAGKVYIQNCYNKGTITTGKNRGGIIAGINSTGTASLSNNYWLSTCGPTYGIYQNSSNSGAVSKTATQLKALATTLGSAYKADSDNINQGYPILSWQLLTK